MKDSQHEIPPEGLTILAEIVDCIIPLTEEKFLLLEKVILIEGCKEPLVVWHKEGQIILVDGHNRYKICQQNNIVIRTIEIAFNDLTELRVWVLDRQIRKNTLTPDQLSYLRGRRYLLLKENTIEHDVIQFKDISEPLASQTSSKRFHVSERVARLDAKFVEGLAVIQRHNPFLKTKILTGEVNVNRIDVQTLSNAVHPEKIVIRNEFELNRQAQRVRDEILQEVVARVRQIENKDNPNKASSANDLIVFDRNGSLDYVKGQIVSSMAKAITEQDARLINELKDLIERLNDELFETGDV